MSNNVNKDSGLGENDNCEQRASNSGQQSFEHNHENHDHKVQQGHQGNKGHGHHHDIAQNNIAIAFFLNFFFTIIEFIGGFLTNSTAIMANAIHDLGDTFSIGMSWVLHKIGKKPANIKFTYGYPRLSLLGAVINGIVLTIGSILVLLTAVPRLFNPETPVAGGMFFLAIFGVIVNGFAAYKLSSGHTMNERVLNWHLIEDVLGWVAVLIVSCVLLVANVPILDPILSICFTLFILYNVLRNLRETVRLFLQASPDTILRNEIYNGLINIEHVCDIHHLHFWSLDGEKNVLTAHLLIDIPIDEAIHQQIKLAVAEFLARYSLAHTTIELENAGEICRDSD